MNAPSPTLSAMTSPRAKGAALVSSKLRGARTVIDGLRQQGSLKLVFPRASSAALEAVMVNTAGGVTGGDQFDMRAVVGNGTTLHITTQAAERAYRAVAPQIGRLTNHLTVHEKARLHWLPQETILFDGAAIDRRTKVTLHGNAQLLFCETLVFGRTTMGEVLNDAQLHDRLHIQRDGAPLYLDSLRMDGAMNAHLAKAAIANGAGALSSIVYVAPDAEAHLDTLRDTLGGHGGASLMRDDMLVARVLGYDSYTLRQTLVPALAQLSGTSLPRPWMI